MQAAFAAPDRDIRAYGASPDASPAVNRAAIQKPVCFPAVPAAWKGKRVAFRNIRIPGGRKVSATLGDAESSPRQGPEGF